MARKALIQIRRGMETAMGSLAVGELGYCTDTGKLFIGTASGNTLLVAAQSTGDMLKSIYDTNNDGKVDAAAVADNAAKVNNLTVLTAVPVGAKFTDTVYTHPVNHPASIITQDTSNRFVTDVEKTAWNGKAVGSHLHDDRYFRKVKDLGNTENLNDLTETGRYHQTGNANTSLSRNYPAAEAGLLCVYKDGYVYQTYQTYNNSGFWMRTLYSGTWYPWKKTADYGAGDKVAAAVQADNAAKVNNLTVLTAVPTGAKFTDTVYAHPATHPASIIAQDASNRFATDVEKAIWNAKESTTGAQTKATKALNDAKAYTDSKVGSSGWVNIITHDWSYVDATRPQYKKMDR